MSGPHPGVHERTLSSPEMLAHRLRQVSRAYRAGDEPAAREELRALSVEARLLAQRMPLFETPLDRRMTVYAKARMGSVG